jgi:hypothetical protein
MTKVKETRFLQPLSNNQYIHICFFPSPSNPNHYLHNVNMEVVVVRRGGGKPSVPPCLIGGILFSISKSRSSSFPLFLFSSFPAPILSSLWWWWW